VRKDAPDILSLRRQFVRGEYVLNLKITIEDIVKDLLKRLKGPANRRSFIKKGLAAAGTAEPGRRTASMAGCRVSVSPPVVVLFLPIPISQEEQESDLGV
jgi:hypothetical protein